MEEINCPIQCIKAGCDEKDWLVTHESFVLIITATISATLGVMFSYFLKSRCTRISFCGFSCDRTPVDLEAVDLAIPTPTPPPNTPMDHSAEN